MTAPVRVRFAPSPTGKLHIGGARTALFNWAWARRNGGQFILRIEDTDPTRSRREHEDEILSGLAWLGIDWDEGPDRPGDFGPYRQSERAELHAEAAGRLVEGGVAYRCFYTPERLAELRATQEANKETPAYDRHCRDLSREDSDRRAAAGEPYVLRFAVPDGETRFVDRMRGEIVFQNEEVDDWIMVRTDGAPTYNFVCVLDDAAMKISLVLRGVEHLVNTPKQVLLYRALGLEAPEFGHLPLMLGTDKKKLSKRTGGTALLSYKDEGYPPEAVFNFLALQGWALDGETEVFSADELVAAFDPANVSLGGSIFDVDKFRWLAGEYVRSQPLERTAARAKSFVVAAGLTDDADLEARSAWFERLVALAQERIHLYSDLPEQVAWAFAQDGAVEFEEKALKGARKHADGRETLVAFRSWLTERLEAQEAVDAIRAGARDWVGERGIKFPVLFQPLRCALTGKAGGPDLFDVIDLVGRDAALARIDAGLERIWTDD